MFKFAMATATVSLWGGLAVAQSASINLVIHDSKQVFLTTPKSFEIAVGNSPLACKDMAFYLGTSVSLFESGWDVAQTDRFADVTGPGFRNYIFARCRNADTEYVAWFGGHREFEFLVSEQLLDKNFDPSKMPLIVRARSLTGGSPSYYRCQTARSRVLIDDKPTHATYQVKMDCAASRVSKSELGPIEFIDNPGPFAHIAAYRGYALPAVSSTPASFARVKSSLLNLVPQGKFKGAMSTLRKTCDLEISVNGDTLFIDHTITTGRARTRRLELKSQDLLGAVEGALYADPIRYRAGEKSVGRFAAAEFRTEKGSLVMRFDQFEGLDGQVVRINGSEAYCRRLVRQ